MQKSCRQCQMSFEITDADLAFYERIDVPLPTWCPACRHLRRHASINDYVFYTRNCDNCRKVFISIFPPKSEYMVYCQNCWYSDDRNDKTAARNYNENKPFFEQFNELLHTVPHLGMMGTNNENCDFCNSVANCKNCYLISESSNCEDCLYSYWIQKSKDCLDCTYLHECERCYSLIYCFNCYDLKYSQNCFNCSDSFFLDNCIGCQNCLLSTNLRHKQYYIWNKPYSKQDYFSELEKLKLADRNSIENLKEKFQNFLQTQPRKNLQIENAENCSGDYIRNAKNCHNVFHCYDAEECAYGEHIWRGAKYCYDSNTAGRNAELLYETTNSGIDSYNVKFCRYCWGCNDTEYSVECMNGSYLFGCAGLKAGAKYCIFNKQYSPAEYEKLAQKIKKNMRTSGEYGEFFPISIALFGYNNSVSFDEFPSSKEEAIKKGWKWELIEGYIKGQGTIDMNKLPAVINGAQDSLLKEIFTCTNCNRNFKITSKEFTFYKAQNLPIPVFCPDCRHRQRLSQKNKKILNQTQCVQCRKSTQTTLDPQKYKTILCKACYKNFVY